MDDDSQPTVVIQALKEFKEFVSSGKKRFRLSYNPRQHLDFSDLDESSAHNESFGVSYPLSKRQKVDNIVGFDVTKKLREKDIEINDAKAKITTLELHSHELETSLKEIKLKSSVECDRLKNQHIIDRELIDGLQFKLKCSQSKEQETKEESSKCRMQLAMAEAEFQKKKSQIQEDYMKKTNELYEQLSNIQKENSGLHKSLSESKGKEENAVDYAEELNAKLLEYSEKVKNMVKLEMEVDNLNIQLAKANVKIRDSLLYKEDMARQEKQFKNFNVSLIRLKKLEAEFLKIMEENKFHRDVAQNIQLLEEKLSCSQMTISLLEERTQKLADVEIERDNLKSELYKYDHISIEELGLEKKPSVSEYRNLLRSLKENDRAFANNMTNLINDSLALKEMKAHMEDQDKALQNRISHLETMNKKTAIIQKRLQRKLHLVSRERDGLKDIITSYESESTMNPTAIVQEKIRRLEEQVSAYKAEIVKVEEEMSQFILLAPLPPVESSSSSTVECKEKERKLEELEAQVKVLTEENESLTSRLEYYSLKVENRKLEIEKVREENEALKERIKLLKEGETKDLTMKVEQLVSGESASLEIIDLQSKISTLETQNKRFLEAFKQKASDVREAVYMLTGYRVDSPEGSDYKLTHMYADSTNDYLLFKKTPEGELQLLDTSYSSSLEDLIDCYLFQDNSYPAFLAAVTMDLFNRRTNATSAVNFDEADAASVGNFSRETVTVRSQDSSEAEEVEGEEMGVEEEEEEEEMRENEDDDVEEEEEEEGEEYDEDECGEEYSEEEEDIRPKQIHNDNDDDDSDICIVSD